MKTEIKNILLLLGILTCFSCATMPQSGLLNWLPGINKEGTMQKDRSTPNSGITKKIEGASSQPSVTQPSNKTFTVGGVSFTMVYVQGGTFTMGATTEQGGDDDENPSHSVTLSNYYISETEVTQGLWGAVMGSNVRQQRDKEDTSCIIVGEGKNYPMYYVSYDECLTFIKKLNSLTGQRFHLPTEAQWEYAARGGKKSRGYKYAGSNTLDNVAWYHDNSGNSTHPVKTKSPNELGLYDMSGNVWEWCQDWYGEYSSGSQTNPTGTSSGSSRVCRGGSWYYGARDCRVSRRGYAASSRRTSDLGFRLAL